MPKLEDHECLLLNQNEDIIKQCIDTGILISLRRKFRSLCMVNRSHPSTAGLFKSNAACRNEEIRHMVHYYYMIHPYSILDLYWEFFMFFIYSCQFTLTPINAAYWVGQLNWNVYRAKFTVDMIQVADVIKLFFTGYYSDKKSKIILDHRHIARHYLFTYFFFDVISSTFSFMYPLRSLGYFNDAPDRVLISIRFLNRLKIIRVGRWLNILELFRQYMGYSSYLFKGIKVVLIFIVVTFWCFSIDFFIENYIKRYISQQEENHDQFLNDIYASYYAATVVLLVVSYGNKDITEIMQYVMAIFFLCFGFALQLFLYAQILQVWTKYASAENKHHSLHKQLKEYMKYKELPVALRQRIFTYFEFKFHKQFFKESDINNMVSPLLKQEILLHVTKNHIEKVDFFTHLPENVLVKVVGHMKSEIYLAGDVIISAGSAANCMFFIYHGTVAVYTPSGKEVCHLEDGSHFGEIALIFNETRVATVVAVTECELFMLKRSDFLDTIEPYPEIKNELISLANQRLQDTIQDVDSFIN